MLTDGERVCRALESIAESLVKFANPLLPVGNDRAVVRDLIATAGDPAGFYDGTELSDRIIRALENAGYEIVRKEKA